MKTPLKNEELILPADFYGEDERRGLGDQPKQIGLRTENIFKMMQVDNTQLSSFRCSQEKCC